MNSAAPSDEECFTVYIVDDDPDVRDALQLLLCVRGYQVRVFENATDFLSVLNEHCAGCVVTDIRMPGMSGLELQEELTRRGCALPVIVLTAHADVQSARVALRAHAIDFLLKPFSEADFIAALGQGYEAERTRRAARCAAAEDSTLTATLTPRELQVTALLATGAQNLAIAEQLGISPRTVEIHKARCMEKLKVRNIAELVRFADRTGIAAGAAKDSTHG